MQSKIEENINRFLHSENIDLLLEDLLAKTEEDFIKAAYLLLIRRLPDERDTADLMKQLGKGVDRKLLLYDLSVLAVFQEELPVPYWMGEFMSLCTPKLTLKEIVEKGFGYQKTVTLTYILALDRLPDLEARSHWKYQFEHGLKIPCFMWFVAASPEGLDKCKISESQLYELAELFHERMSFRELLSMDTFQLIEFCFRFFAKRGPSNAEREFWSMSMERGWNPGDLLWALARTTGGLSQLKPMNKKGGGSPSDWLCFFKWYVLHKSKVARVRTLLREVSSGFARLQQFEKKHDDVARQLEIRYDEVVRQFEKKHDDVARQLEKRHDDVACQLKALLDELEVRIEERLMKNQLVPTSNNVMLVRHPLGLILGLPGEEWAVLGLYAFGNGFERGTTKILGNLLKDGMVAVDVGAHIGLHTITMALKVGPSGRVHCFEPNPRACEILKMNVFSNQVLNARVTRNITVHQSAVADYCGEGSFNVVVGNSGWSTMYEPPEATTKTQAVRVQVTALDDALKDEKRIDLIKIDAEGAERKIFDGLINILQKNREIKIIMEFGPENLIRAGIDPGEFVDYLAGFGLRIRAIDEALGTTEDISREALLACDSVNVLLWRDIS